MKLTHPGLFKGPRCLVFHSCLFLQKGFDAPHDLHDPLFFLKNTLDDLFRRQMGDVFLARFYAWILEDLGLSVKTGLRSGFQGLQPQKIYGHAGGYRDQKDSQPDDQEPSL
jgi:hypothetical protein